MKNNLVDQIGSYVTVWCKDGNGMENRILLTIDEFGLVVNGYRPTDNSGKSFEETAVFVPWCQVKYVDYPRQEKK